MTRRDRSPHDRMHGPGTRIGLLALAFLGLITLLFACALETEGRGPPLPPGVDAGDRG